MRGDSSEPRATAHTPCTGSRNAPTGGAGAKPRKPTNSATPRAANCELRTSGLRTLILAALAIRRAATRSASPCHHDLKDVRASDDAGKAPAAADEHCRVRLRQQLGDRVDRLGGFDDGKGRLHDVADRGIEQLGVLEAPGRERPVTHGADAAVSVHD